MDVMKAFLRYTEFQPDAQRGWALPPAILTPIEISDNFSTFTRPTPRIYTSNLLIAQATPDFSMPYNVIIFTCSLVAFIFRSVFNGLTQRSAVLKVSPVDG